MTLTFRVIIVVTILLIAAFAAVGNLGASTDPQLVHINLTDTQLSVSQFVVTAGRTVKFEIANGGSIPHRVVIRSMTDTNMSAVDEPVIGARTVRTIEQKLPAGIYRVFCGIADHAERGMATAIAAETAARFTAPFPINGLVSLLALVLGCVYIIGDSLGLRLVRSGGK